MWLETEVFVAGAGTAGSICGISASRLGLKTIVAERTGLVGGTGVTALMGSFANLMADTEGRPLLGGILPELVDRLAKAGGLPCSSSKDAIHGRNGMPISIPYRPEIYMEVLMDMLEEAGAALLLNTSYAGIEEKGDLKVVHLLSCGQQIDVQAKVVIDATGDALIAKDCGALIVDAEASWGTLMRLISVDFGKTYSWVMETKPWEPDETYEPWLRKHLDLKSGEVTGTLRLLLDPLSYDHAPMRNRGDHNLTKDRIAYIQKRWETEGIVYTLELSMLRHLIRKAADAGDFIIDRKCSEFTGVTFNGDGIAYGGWGEGVVLCNVAKPYGFHTSSPQESTQAHLLAFRYNRMMAEFFRKYVPGFEKSMMMDMGSQTVCRTGRTILGCDQLKGEADRLLYHQTIYLFGGIYEFQKGTRVTYGKILPQNCRNLFVIGKGSSHGGQYRSQLSCMAMGGAAAAASRVILDSGRDSHCIDRDRLAEQLLSMGVILEGENR